MERDYKLLEQLTRLGDDVLINVEEVATLTGFAEITIQQRTIKGFPRPVPGPRRLRWRLGDVRVWGRGATSPISSARRGGR